MKKILIIFGILAALSCTVEKNPGEKIVVTTTGFVTDTVSRIAGNKVKIVNLIDYGQDPHSYKPLPADMAQVEKADLIFVNGYSLEEGLLDIIENNSSSEIIELSERVTAIEHESEDEEEEEDEEDGDDDHHHEIDPHTWMSPLNVMIWAENACRALSEINPENREYFESNLESYKKELADLHKDLQSRFSQIAPEKRLMITDHDSFAYFARDYDFKIMGTIISGASGSSDTSAKALTQLIDLMNRIGISTVFIGETSGPAMKKLSENLKDELKQPIDIINLKTGSPDKPESETGGYISFMNYNAEQILRGLRD